MNDSELLRRFVDDEAEEAFAELVRRRLDLVYAAALRQLAGDAHRAQDVAQEVFVILARKARALVTHPDLAGWLYTTTHLAALAAIRTEQRRRRREQESTFMDHVTQAGREPASDWERARPLLDAALHELGERDRQVVRLRFFEQQPFAAIGSALGLSENAAQKSTERALDRLQAALARRGVTSTGAALGAALAGHAAVAAPAGLAANITSAALAGAGAAGIFTSMSLTKITLLALAPITASAAIAIGLVRHERTQAAAATAGEAAARTELAALQARIATAEQRAKAAEADNATLLQAVADFRTAQSATAPVVTRAALPPPAAERERPIAKPVAREVAVAELIAIVEQVEKQARQSPYYRSYRTPDTGPLTPEQQQMREFVRQTAEVRGKEIFTIFGKASGVQFRSPYGNERMRQSYPTVTPEDWAVLDARYTLALAEAVLVQEQERAARGK